jgi:hypothetical protein
LQPNSSLVEESSNLPLLDILHLCFLIDSNPRSMHTGRSESSENLARKGQKEASCLLLNPCPQLLQSPIDITLVPRGNLHLSLSLAVKHNLTIVKVSIHPSPGINVQLRRLMLCYLPILIVRRFYTEETRFTYPYMKRAVDRSPLGGILNLIRQGGASFVGGKISES